MVTPVHTHTCACNDVTMNNIFSFYNSHTHGYTPIGHTPSPCGAVLSTSAWESTFSKVEHFDIEGWNKKKFNSYLHLINIRNHSH